MPISQTALAGALARELEYRKPRVVSRHLRKLPYASGELVKQNGDLPAGAKDITVELEDGRAEAVVVAGDVSDVPVSEVTITEDKYKIVEVRTGWRYGFRELDTQDFLRNAGLGRRSWNFITKRMEYANRALQEKSHELAAFGMPQYDIKGMLNNDYPVFTETFDPHAVTDATAYQLLDWIVSHIESVSDDSDMAEEPNVLAITQKLHTKLLTTRPTGDSSQNIYDLVLDACSPMGLQRIVKLNELRSDDLVAGGVQAVGDNLDRMHIYTLDGDDTVCRHFSNKRIYPPEYRDTSYKVVMGQCFSSVILNYTNSGRYVDYPKAN